MSTYDSLEFCLYAAYGYYARRTEFKTFRLLGAILSLSDVERRTLLDEVPGDKRTSSLVCDTYAHLRSLEAASLKILYAGSKPHPSTVHDPFVHSFLCTWRRHACCCCALPPALKPSPSSVYHRTMICLKWGDAGRTKDARALLYKISRRCELHAHFRRGTHGRVGMSVAYGIVDQIIAKSHA